MNPPKITLIGLVLSLFFGAAQNNDTFPRTTAQYQLYRLSDDPSDDRRPKLAINDQGTVWVVWESNRDGDFDIYGKRYEKSNWSTLITIAQDTIITFLCDIFFVGDSILWVFGTEVKANDPYSVVGNLFHKQCDGRSLSEKQVIAYVHHNTTYWWYYMRIPQIGKLQKKIIACYHRESYPFWSWNDSLFLKIYLNNIWQPEMCDTVFLQESKGSYNDMRNFPYQKITSSNKVIFLIQQYLRYSVYTGDGVNDIGFVINDSLEEYYTILNSRWGRNMYRTSYNYGSDRNSIFCGGELQKTNVTIFRKININEEHKAIIQREWNYIFTDNLSISQLSDLVGFVWSDSANIYVKTFQDSTWYETLEISLNGLTHIDNSLTCAVYNNQEIWITFDAIYDGNKDVYALSVPVSFVVDTLMTSVKQNSANNALPKDFALFQNYPNPFNSSTEIKYSLPQGKSTYYVTLKIYDITGRLVNTLVNQNQAAGRYSIRWDATDMKGNNVSSGVYFCLLQAGSIQISKKLLLLE